MSVSAPLRPCANRNCAHLVRRGVPCPVHGGAEQRRSNVETRRLYRTSRWRALRMQVLTEDPVCRDCETKGLTRLNTEVDHIVPHQNDLVLFWDRSNLQGMCATHHALKTRGGE